MYYYQIAMYKISIVSDLLIERSCKVTLMEIIHDLFPFSATNNWFFIRQWPVDIMEWHVDVIFLKKNIWDSLWQT